MTATRVLGEWPGMWGMSVRGLGGGGGPSTESGEPPAYWVTSSSAGTPEREGRLAAGNRQVPGSVIWVLGEGGGFRTPPTGRRPH